MPRMNSSPHASTPALMTKGRLEAFSDGVLAIIITIMVLELKVPVHADKLSDLQPLLGVFLSYVLSFVYVGIYWNNHHHLLHTARRVTGGILWANLHLMFWLSLVPFATGWMGENHFAAAPTAVYGVVLLMSASAFWILQRCILASHGPHSVLAQAVGSDLKGKISPALYAIAIPLALLGERLGFGEWGPLAASGIFAVVAMIWLVPDRRIERALERAGENGS